MDDFNLVTQRMIRKKLKYPLFMQMGKKEKNLFGENPLQNDLEEKMIKY